MDTNIPLDILKEISEYSRVAVMLCPQSMSVERFFNRDDPEKQFLLNVIDSCDDPIAVMDNYRQGLARINSKEHYDEYANSGFFTVVREDNGVDTREEVCRRIANHFRCARRSRTCCPCRRWRLRSAPPEPSVRPAELPGDCPNGWGRCPGA